MKRVDLSNFFSFLIFLSNTFIFYFIWSALSETILSSDYFRLGNYLLVAQFVILFYLFSRIYGSFKVGEYKISELLYFTFLSNSVSFFILYLNLSLIERSLIPIHKYLLLYILTILSSFIIVYLFNRIYVYTLVENKVLIITDAQNKDLLIEEYNHRPHFLNISHETQYLSVSTDFDLQNEILDRYERIFVHINDVVLRNKIIDYGILHSKSTYIIPRLEDLVVRNSELSHLFDRPLLVYEADKNFSLISCIIKRIFDVVLSFFGLLFSLPILVFVALLIKLDDNGPVFYVQKRVGKNGKIFSLIKLRSMIVNAEQVGGVQFARLNDSRITRVGKYLRQYRIDELPQLINVLKGEMSIVGPRPERPEIYEKISKEFVHFKTRLNVKAGITGYSQVFGKYNTNLQDKLLMDLEYIYSYNILLDIKIIILTIRALFQKDSSKGY